MKIWDKICGRKSVEEQLSDHMRKEFEHMYKEDEAALITDQLDAAMEAEKSEPNKPEQKTNITFSEDPLADSTIVFSIDKDLNVNIKTKINKNIIEALVANDFIKPEQAEDEGAIQVAFVLMSSEVTEQMLESINNIADIYENG